jgi:hypothetical protein
MDTEPRGPGRYVLWMVNEDAAYREVAARREIVADEPGAGGKLAAALEGWVAAFDRAIEESGDFAASVATMTADGCFDVRAVVERWVLANPSGTATVVQQPPAAPEPIVPAEPVPEPALERGPERVADEVRAAPRPDADSSPDVAYFHSLLQGGIERAQIDEAFPGFRQVIDEAVSQHAASAPILSDVPPKPSRADLNDEIRGLLQQLQESGKRDRRRWRRA